MRIILCLSCFLVFSGLSHAASITAENHVADRTFLSFLQYTNEAEGLVENFFTSRFFTDGRTITKELTFEGELSVFSIDLQERFFLSDADHFRGDGSTYRWRATTDRPFNDFVFTVTGDGLANNQPVVTPEPATFGLFGLGVAALLGYRRFTMKHGTTYQEDTRLSWKPPIG